MQNLVYRKSASGESPNMGYDRGGPLQHDGYGRRGGRRGGAQRLLALAFLALGAALLLGLYTGHVVVTARPGSTPAAAAAALGLNATSAAAAAAAPRPEDTLVVYIFSNTDPEYIANLRFFARHGMAAGDGCEYVVVVQEDEGAEVRRGAWRGAPGGMPPGECAGAACRAHAEDSSRCGGVGQAWVYRGLGALPPNGRYLRHPNRCYDWGTIGWVFSSGAADPEGYKFFIFMNSSVRGPFLPPYARVSGGGGGGGGRKRRGWGVGWLGGLAGWEACAALLLVLR